MPSPLTRIVAAALALTLVGCDPPGTVAVKDPGKVKPPPGWHRAKPTPIDPALQASARRELTVALASPDDLIRAHALETVADDRLTGFEPLVLQRLRDRSPLVRKAAAITAGRLRVADAHADLLALATSAPPPPTSADDPFAPIANLQAKMAAVFGLHQLGDDRFTHLFEQTALDPRPEIRGDTALLLELIGNPTAAPVLVPLMRKDRSVNVRLQAAEALWTFGDEKGEDALVEASISQYASDRMIGLLGLAAPRNRDVLRHEVGMLNDEYRQVALVAARAAGQLGNDAGVGVAERAAADGDPMERALAALALGDIGRADTQPTLRKLLADEVPDVRIAAAAGVLQVGSHG